MKSGRSWGGGLLLAVALLAGAAGAAGAAGLTITDLAGRELAVPEAPRRVVCLGPGALRLAVYLEAQDLVAGVEEMEKRFPRGRPYLMAQPQLLRLPTVGPGGPAAINQKPDLERLLGVAPEVVFVTYLEAARAEEVQRLLGVPVVVLSYGAFASLGEEFFTSLRLMARILGKEARARAVEEYVAGVQADLARRMADQAPAASPTVYVGGVGLRGAQGLESSDAGYQPFAWLGARSVLGGRPAGRGHVFLDREELLKLDPEVIFLDGGGLELVAADYAKRPAYYQALRAFAAGRIHVLFPFNWYTTNLETVLADAYAVGRIIHPAGFADLDPMAKADEICRFMVGAAVAGGMADLYGPLGARPGFLPGGGN